MLTIRPSARSLALTSLLLWLGSLFMLGFTTRIRDGSWFGYDILAEGWLDAITGGSVAWLANPFLLWAGFALLKGWRAGLSSPAAALFACDLLRLHRITTDEAGNTAPLDAYGWGAVTWCVAIAVMLAASGTRARELRLAGAPKVNRVDWLRPLGFVIVGALVVAVVIVNYEQRLHSNTATRAALNDVAFKLGPLCNVEEPAVGEPMRGLNGPLALRFHTGHGSPGLSAQELIQWGIPVAREGDRDYSLLESREAFIVTSRPAAGPVAAVLDLWDDEHDGRVSHRAVLAEAASRRQVFDQSWVQANPDVDMCPRYVASDPKATDQPRKLLLQGLNVAPGAARDLVNFDHYWAVIGQPLKVEVLSRGSGGPKPPQVTQCSDNAGPVDRDVDARLHEPFDAYHTAFHIGEAVFYDHDPTFNLRCDGDRVYFYRGWADVDPAKPARVRIEARSLTDYRLLWAGLFPLAEAQGLGVPRSIQIRSLSQTDSGLMLELVNVESGHWARVNLPLVR